MSYAVKEIFYTLQGEGRNAGRAAVFCRFAGCNLWSGQEADRPRAVCQFCDTDFVGFDPSGGKFTTTADLVAAIARAWPGSAEIRPFAVLTGGEPLLQVDDALVAGLHEAGFEIAVETNGTVTPPEGLDWLCVSPKAGTEIVIRQGNELKLVYPQYGIDPKAYEHLMFDNFLLSPMDGPDRAENSAAAVAYCLANPKWRLSLQTHKLLGIP